MSVVARAGFPPPSLPLDPGPHLKLLETLQKPGLKHQIMVVDGCALKPFDYD